MPELSERTATFTDSVIRRMTRICLQYGAVNLSQGFPDFEPPREILDRFAGVSREDFQHTTISCLTYQNSVLIPTWNSARCWRVMWE